MADDADLAALRAQRMAQMQAGRGGGGGPGGGQEAEQQARMQEARNSMLAAILTQAARARLNSLAMVKPEKAQMVESMLFNMYQQRQIQGQVDEDQLRALLERVSEQTQKKSAIHYRRHHDSDDE